MENNLIEQSSQNKLEKRNLTKRSFLKLMAGATGALVLGGKGEDGKRKNLNENQMMKIEGETEVERAIEFFNQSFKGKVEIELDPNEYPEREWMKEGEFESYQPSLEEIAYLFKYSTMLEDKTGIFELVNRNGPIKLYFIKNLIEEKYAGVCDCSVPGEQDTKKGDVIFMALGEGEAALDLIYPHELLHDVEDERTRYQNGYEWSDWQLINEFGEPFNLNAYELAVLMGVGMQVSDTNRCVSKLNIREEYDAWIGDMIDSNEEDSMWPRWASRTKFSISDEFVPYNVVAIVAMGKSELKKLLGPLMLPNIEHLIGQVKGRKESGLWQNTEDEEVRARDPEFYRVMKLIEQGLEGEDMVTEIIEQRCQTICDFVCVEYLGMSRNQLEQARRNDYVIIDDLRISKFRTRGRLKKISQSNGESWENIKNYQRLPIADDVFEHAVSEFEDQFREKTGEELG